MDWMETSFHRVCSAVHIDMCVPMEEEFIWTSISVYNFKTEVLSDNKSVMEI